MTTFTDGPAKGQRLMLKRAPYFLRVVEANGKWDALDQPDDSPSANERIEVYHLSEKPGMVHLNMGRGRGGFYPIATYRLNVISPPEDAVLRDNERWRAWCRDNASRVPAHFLSNEEAA